MDMGKIEAAMKEIDVSTMPWDPQFSLSICPTTGKPRIGCALRAPDTHTHEAGLPVQTGVKAGGLWPAHSVALDSDEPTAVWDGALAALDKAVHHETRENYKVRNRLYADPHAMV